VETSLGSRADTNLPSSSHHDAHDDIELEALPGTPSTLESSGGCNSPDFRTPLPQEDVTRVLRRTPSYSLPSSSVWTSSSMIWRTPLTSCNPQTTLPIRPARSFSFPATTTPIPPTTLPTTPATPNYSARTPATPNHSTAMAPTPLTTNTSTNPQRRIILADLLAFTVRMRPTGASGFFSYSCSIEPSIPSTVATLVRRCLPIGGFLLTCGFMWSITFGWEELFPSSANNYGASGISLPVSSA